MARCHKMPRWVFTIIALVVLLGTAVQATERNGFVLADKPTAASYAPSGSYSYNSLGLLNWVTRIGTGDYLVSFKGLGGLGRVGGHVQVSAYGSGTERCRAVSWESSRLDFDVVVNCVDETGNLVDGRYTVSMSWPLSPAAPRAMIGNFAVRQTYCLNLDSVLGDYSCGAEADIHFQAVTANERYVSPRKGTVIALFSSILPTVQDCASAPLASARINVTELEPKWWVCFRTNTGRYGTFSLQQPVDPSPGTLHLFAQTWRDYPSGWPQDRSRLVHVVLGTCADIDGTLDQPDCGRDADFAFQTVGGIRHLVPMNGATFANIAGPGGPNIEKCDSATLSTNAIDVGGVTPQNQMYLCARTNIGPYGYLRVIQTDTSGSGGASSLVVEIRRWSQELPD